jgi:hypothetical protein
MGTNPFLMALMPISQATGWHLVLRSSSSEDLYWSVAVMSTFYVFWALYNKYFAGQKKELGHVSMGVTALGSFVEIKWVAMIGAVLVVANFGVIAKLLLVDWDATTLANKAGKTKTWALIFKGYFVSSILFWSTVFYKISTLKEA